MQRAQTGVRVMTGIDRGILRRLGMDEIMDNGVVQEVGIRMARGATVVSVVYVPKADRRGWFKSFFARRKREAVIDASSKPSDDSKSA